MRGKKKVFLVAAAGVSIFSTVLLYFTGPGTVFPAMVLVVAGYTGYTVAMTFYNAFLPGIAGGAESIEKLSGIGWGLGYIGGLTALLCMASMVPSVAEGKSIILLTGGMFTVFALPAFLILKDSPHPAKIEGASIKDGFLRILTTFKEIRSFRRVFVFLLGYFFVSDAMSTVIVFFSSYTVHTLHFSVRENVMLLMIIQLSAAAGSIATGFIARRIGALRTVILTILVWILALLGIFAFSSTSAFYVLSVCAGLVLGGTQATARSFIALESPPEKQGEFFGFMTFGSKVAAIFGPLLYGIISQQTSNPRIAILSLEVFFIAGLIVMLKVPHENKH
jgi:UMF1 family MFS transporter